MVFVLILRIILYLSLIVGIAVIIPSRVIDFLLNSRILILIRWHSRLLRIIFFPSLQHQLTPCFGLLQSK
jgi:hypothetical protein